MPSLSKSVNAAEPVGLPELRVIFMEAMGERTKSQLLTTMASVLSVDAHNIVPIFRSPSHHGKPHVGPS